MNSRDAHNLPLAQPLTPREQEILNCIGDNMSNRQIADRLTIAMSTVKWYVRQIYNKLGVNNRGEAVARAQSLGLLPAGELESLVRNNLPAAITPFVGRKKELATLAELIADPQIRIITIIGPGGMGKTRLALEAAGRELHPLSPFPDGIFFVSLAPIDSAAEIVNTLAAAVDFHFQNAEQSSPGEIDQIINYLGQKQMLLVLDNFEHILDGRNLLAEISERAANISLLVTSHERLHLRGEQLFPLQGLETPPTRASVKEAAVNYAAAQLFINISKRSTPDFELLEGDAEHLLRICRLVEGMPLGLELAASWVNLLPLSAIAADIEQSMQLLTSEHHDVPQRHRSMQATLDTSWKRLSYDQRRGLQELTVFRGGFTRTAAFKVAGAALPLLVTLVNKSWLSYDRQRDRYNIHELLRQYGASQLGVNSDQKTEAHNRHSAFFCGYLKEREAGWYGAGQQEVASEVQREIENIQNAWRRAANQGNHVLLVQGLNGVCRFYHWEGRMADGLNACRLAGNGLSRSLSEQYIDDPQRLALWSQVLAWESEFVTDIAQKEKLLAQGQDLLDRVMPTGRDTRAEQAFIFLEKALSAGNRDFEEAVRFANLGLELYRELGDRWSEARVSGILAGSYVHQGAYEQVNELLRHTLLINRQMDDAQGTAQTLVFLGLSARYQGGFEEAETLHRQSLKLFQKLADRRSERIGLGVLSFTLAWAGKFNAARESAKRGVELDRDLGLYPNPPSLNPLSNANIHLGRYTDARALSIESLENARRRGRLMELNDALMVLGQIAFAEGDLAGAKHYLLESSDIMAEVKHIYRALPGAILSYVLRAQGDDTLARDCLIDALRSGIETHSISTIMYCLPAAALLAADDGQPLRTIEFYSLAQQFGHITHSLWFEAIACRELDGVLTTMPPKVSSATLARGRELDLWATADDLLRELTNH